MEKKVNRYYIQLFAYSLFGYFFGSMLYAMFGGQNGILNLVSGFVGSLILTRALDRHNQKKVSLVQS